MVMPRSRSRSMLSSSWACMSRLATVLVNSSRRSARVLLPWSMWAMMQKLRIFFTEGGFSATRRYGLPQKPPGPVLRTGCRACLGQLRTYPSAVCPATRDLRLPLTAAQFHRSQCAAASKFVQVLPQRHVPATCWLTRLVNFVHQAAQGAPGAARPPAGPLGP